MAAKAHETRSFEEILFHNDRVSLCLLVNRRTRCLRIIDFRSGPNPAKRMFVMSLAQREGMERVFTLVEREEVSTWSRLGFHREGSIPGFYKRSDAHILGAMVPRALTNGRDAESGVHPVNGAANNRAEKLYQSARKLAKEREGQSMPAVRVQTKRDQDVVKATSQALRNGRALTGFEPFGRDVDRKSYLCTARGGFSLAASVESQPCFSNAFLELLTAPRTEKEAAATTAAIRGLCDALFEQDVVSCFAVSPIDDLQMSAAYLMNGFRRTGRLQQHLLRGEERSDLFVWSRKLASPDEG